MQRYYTTNNYVRHYIYIYIYTTNYYYYYSTLVAKFLFRLRVALSSFLFWLILFIVDSRRRLVGFLLRFLLNPSPLRRNCFITLVCIYMLITYIFSSILLLVAYKNMKCLLCYTCFLVSRYLLLILDLLAARSWERSRCIRFSSSFI